MPDTPYPLGRIKSDPDPRNFPLSLFLKATPTKLQTLNSSVQYTPGIAPSVKAWINEATRRIEQQSGTPVPIPPPTPTPTPAPTPLPVTPDIKIWPTTVQLDQGNTGHCVGFAWAQWGDCSPVNDSFTNDDAHAIYYECKILDREPQAENGTSVHAGAKAMLARKRIGAYAWTQNLEEIKLFVLTQGPLVVGTYWTNDMFNPDAHSFVHPTGAIRGGHAYYICGYDRSTNSLRFQNNWGSNWADRGFFYMNADEWFSIFSKNGDGEACAGVELAL